MYFSVTGYEKVFIGVKTYHLKSKTEYSNPPTVRLILNTEKKNCFLPDTVQ
jgi:hypothetical protein